MANPEKPCGINQTQMDWLRLLISSDSSEVAILKNMSIPSRPMTKFLTVFKTWNYLERGMTSS